MFALIANFLDLPLKAILHAYKFQPNLEKRHEQLKSVQKVAPVWPKNISRVETLLFLYFTALLVQAPLEHEIRFAMTRERIESLPLYSEERQYPTPSAERIFELFSSFFRQRLRKAGRLVEVSEPGFSRLQKRVICLTRMSAEVFNSRT